MAHNDNRLTPTIRKMAFGDTERIQGLTPESLSLKIYADRANTAWGEIHDTHQRRMKDLTATEFGRLKSSADFAKGKMTALGNAVTEAAARARAEADRIRAKMDAELRPRDPAQTLLDGELRAYLRSLPTERVIGAARSDPALLRAAVTAPAALSGIQADVHKTLQSEHLAAVMPEDVAKYADLSEAIEAGGTAINSLVKWSHDLIDFATVEAAAVPEAA